MIVLWLAVLGLAFGSFVNAWVWRTHQMSLPKKKRKLSDTELSITKGRSVCPKCSHVLAWYDLLPVISWVFLRGKCRYCRKPISWQYPLVELSTATLFVISYIFWPLPLTPNPLSLVIFILWLASLVGLMALLVYDLKWMLLPNKIMKPVAVVALVSALLVIIDADSPTGALIGVIAAVSVAGGLFYLLFQLSKGEWIGGGDVKLGAVLGLLLATPQLAFLMLFMASLLGLLLALPSLVSRKSTFQSKLPFGPYLIVATVIVKLFGNDLINWYTNTFLRI